MLGKQKLVAVVIAVSLLSNACFARMRRGWTFEELMAKADLVVIADFESSKMTGERWEWGGVDFQGRTTTFRDVNVLKGTKPKLPLQVLTFVYVDGAPPDGPTIVEFRSDRERGIAGPHYLMFLRHTADGRYEPVNGRADHGDSIKVVQEADHND